jgi:hypothetical protein
VDEVERSPISAGDVEGARALIDEALDRRFFKDRFEMASDAEQRYLAAMPRLGMVRFGRPKLPRGPASKDHKSAYRA